MTDVGFVRGVMSGFPEATSEGNRIIVPTHCLYPSNGTVCVVVEGGSAAFHVHDDGRAFDEFTSTGSVSKVRSSVVRHLVARQGLSVTAKGIIRSPVVGASELAAAISLVANVSKEAAHFLIDRYRNTPVSRSLEEALVALLDRQFHHEWRQDSLVLGQSNKEQRFDFDVRLPLKRRLLIKTVKPEASSINAAVVAHLDVRAAGLSATEHRSIYDDAVDWSAADLSLLTVGAPALPISAAPEALYRIAA
jgi:hypothetical protein